MGELASLFSLGHCCCGIRKIYTGRNVWYNTEQDKSQLRRNSTARTRRQQMLLLLLFKLNNLKRTGGVRFSEPTIAESEKSSLPNLSHRQPSLKRERKKNPFFSSFFLFDRLLRNLSGLREKVSLNQREIANLKALMIFHSRFPLVLWFAHTSGQVLQIGQLSQKSNHHNHHHHAGSQELGARHIRHGGFSATFAINIHFERYVGTGYFPTLFSSLD